MASTHLEMETFERVDRAVFKHKLKIDLLKSIRRHKRQPGGLRDQIQFYKQLVEMFVRVFLLSYIQICFFFVFFWGFEEKAHIFISIFN